MTVDHLTENLKTFSISDAGWKSVPRPWREHVERPESKRGPSDERNAKQCTLRGTEIHSRGAGGDFIDEVTKVLWAEVVKAFVNQSYRSLVNSPLNRQPAEFAEVGRDVIIAFYIYHQAGRCMNNTAVA